MNHDKKNIKLLLVDDEEEFLMATSQALGRRGFQVSIAPNGVTALEVIHSDVFDVVVLDVKMPDIDGIEVFRKIHNQYPHLPIIMLTGHSSISDAFQTSKEGIADYLSKPIEIDDLARKIERAVSEAGEKNTQEEVDNKMNMITESIRVMLVDDEVEFLNSLQKIFTRRHIHTITADNGPRALELLQEELVDVLVLDVKMPGMDGLEVLRIVKKKHPGIQVILLSGHPSVESAMRGIKLGANEYLRKPPEIDELIKTIRNLFVQRQEYLESEQKKLIDEIKRRYVD